LLRKVASPICLVLICVIRVLSIFRKSLCSFNTLRFSGPMPTIFQMGGFAFQCSFQSLFRAFFSVFSFSSVGPPLHLSTHCVNHSPLVGPLLALPCRRYVLIFSQTLLTTLSMPESLCRRLKAASLA